MYGGVSGWYGLWLMLAIAGLAVTVMGVLGAAAMRLMLNDETYFSDEA